MEVNLEQVQELEQRKSEVTNKVLAHGKKVETAAAAVEKAKRRFTKVQVADIITKGRFASEQWS